MYDLDKYKKLSYLVMYSSFNNMALSRNNSILNYMYNYCRAGDEGTSVCKNCKHSIKVKIPGSCFAYKPLCIFCINRLFSVRSIIDDVFLDSFISSRSESFKRITKRCLYV